MRSRALPLLSVVAVMAMGVVVGLLPSADAQTTNQPFDFSVLKVVEGPVPAGTVFTVEVVCDQEGVMDAPGTSGVPITATMTFDETGAPLTASTIGVPFGYTCTATETDDGGATTVGYACAVTNATGGGGGGGSPAEGPVPIQLANCVDDQTVAFGLLGSPPGADAEGRQLLGTGTITVTNTFEEEPPPPPDVEPDDVVPDVVPDVVAATPPFTG